MAGSWYWPELELIPLLPIIISLLILATLSYNFIITSRTTSPPPPPLPPGPRSLPIIGYLPFLGRDLHTKFTTMSTTYGPIFKFHLGTKLHVVINSPELIKTVVRDHDDIFSNRNLTVAASVITYGGQDLVFANNNPTWRTLRKIFVHEILSTKNLKESSFLRTDEVRKTIKNIFSKSGTEVDISEICFLTEANVIRRMVWNDRDENGNFEDLGNELRMVAAKIPEILGKPNLSDLFGVLGWFDLQGIERKMREEHEKLDRIFARIIEDRIEYNSMGGVADEGKKDFLQILLDLMQDGKSVTITQVKALLSDFMIAGTETTTTLIEWAMTNIMRNHEVMKRVQQELVEVVGLNNMVEESDLPKLQYLDATIKETFRLHSVAPILLPRVPSKDCVVGGYTIPKGSIIFLNVLSIHRNPQYWDNPLEFKPERFLANDGGNKLDYSGNNFKFLPFGSGRRLCPGVPLAQKMQMFILASLLHSFDWSLPEGEEHDVSESFGLTLKKTKPLVAIPHQRLRNDSLYM